MGLVLSRIFSRKKKTPLEILEGIEEDIQMIEGRRQDTLQRQKKIVGHLIIYSVLLYVVAALLFYFCFFPASLKDRIFYIIPLLIFPIIVIILKRLVTWFYKNEITRSKDKLSELRLKKKKILDEVMDKETYKVAKEILEKFAPNQLRGTLAGKVNPPKAPQLKNAEPQQKTEVPHQTGVIRSSPPGQVMEISRSFPVAPSGPGQSAQQRLLIRPVLPQNRNFMDRLIEIIVGDGPQNRYALICKNCSTHNGMAFKEEFEFIAFRCVYCGFPNPSRKRRTTHQESSSRIKNDERESQSEEETTRSFNAGDSLDTSNLRSDETTENIPPNDQVGLEGSSPAKESDDSKPEPEIQPEPEDSETKKDK